MLNIGDLAGHHDIGEESAIDQGPQCGYDNSLSKAG